MSYQPPLWGEWMPPGKKLANVVLPEILAGKLPFDNEYFPVLDISKEIRLVTLPEGLRVRKLVLAECKLLRELPEQIEVHNLDVTGCISLESFPGNRTYGVLKAAKCASLKELPRGLSCHSLDVSETPIQTLPDDFKVQSRLVLRNCAELVELPAGLKVGALDISGCTSLRALPEELDVWYLDMRGCVSLSQWPKQASIGVGRIDARECVGLTSIPSYVKQLATLDISGCRNLRELPEGLQISGWLDLADTAITSLPASLRGVPLRWRGVPIDERILFRPETITTEEIVADENAERRRVLLARFGYDRFLNESNVEVLDRDRDAGGERRLIRVEFPNDEPLVCLAVRCPSTGRQYMIRVPPTTSSCHEGAAWMAGFSDPAQYKPLIET